MEEEINVARSLLKGAVLGLNAYIKPGGLHRLMPSKVFDEVTCNLVASINYLIEAVDLGVRIREGEIAATGVDYGKLYAGVLKDVYRACDAAHPEYIIPLNVLGLVIGLSNVESILEESNKFKKALDTVNAVNKWSDVKQLIEIFKIIRRIEMYEHLQAVGYTQIALIQSGITFNDVYRVLSSKWRGFSIIDSRESLVFGYLKKFMELNKEYKNIDNTIVAFYMDLIKQHIPHFIQDKVKDAESCKYMATPECAKLMYELDMLLRKNKLMFEWASEITVLISALASYEGAK
ncbi:MAG: hypothetical protein QXS24_00830 [Desulfurococcaceae archaeon]